MKPVIRSTDYNTLKSLLSGYPSHLKSKEMGQLLQELEKADIVDDPEFDPQVIALNSRFEVEDTATGQAWKFTLVLPARANIKAGKISVFSPLGIALIGFRKGMTIAWNLPGGLKTIKIREVLHRI